MKLLFVCMGNICRSPTAKAVVDRHIQQQGLSQHIYTESAGTHAYHVGEQPDPRSQAAARKLGMDISQDLARQLLSDDFQRFDHILVMDEQNLYNARQVAPTTASAQLALMMSYAPDYGLHEVPDPYYGGEDGFVQVLDMLDVAAQRLLAALKPQLNS
ncbi:MAG: low molecular weight phosphotyrosine protein phosphatase [Xanthomonadales bacterium]|nr:low molecular weight phosphotyrosine protein phosphatase [Xanthomonadales bacterium]